MKVLHFHLTNVNQLYPVYDKLSNAEQTQIATALGGVNQRKIFTAVMKNFQTAIDSNTVAMESLNSAEIENEKRADSIEAKTKKVNNSEDLSQDNIDLDSDTSSDN